MKIIFPVWILLTLNALVLFGNDRKTVIYKFNIKQEITRATWRQTRQAFASADSLKAELFLVHMNTYGGVVVDADSIRTKILESRIPVIVFIDNNAASAGALISIACDKIYMRPGSSIGAATVVNQTGEAMPDKYQSYMRSTMRATAEAQGKDTLINGKDTIIRWKRDPRIAEAMVDQRLSVPGISDSGKVITFTPSEAIKYGYCDAEADNVAQVIEKEGIKEYEIVEYKPSWIEKIIGWLVHPIVSGILIMAIIGGIYFEMQSPGIGFALGVARVAAILYFAPLYLEGLAAHWEILLFLAGIALILIEIFAIPGFGITGITGIILLFSGLVFSLLNNTEFDFSGVDVSKIGIAVSTVVLGIFGGFILSLFLGRKLLTSGSGPFRNLALNATQETEKGFISIEPALLHMQGKTGISASVLRPAGKVLIDNEVYDAIAGSGFIEKGEKIVITRIENMQLYVEKASVQL